MNDAEKVMTHAETRYAKGPEGHVAYQVVGDGPLDLVFVPGWTSNVDVMWEELQAQAAMLTRENERYAEFFEHAPDAYLITDAGGGVREANRSALELLGAARDDLAGRPLSEHIAEERNKLNI